MKGLILFTGTTGAGKTTHGKILAEKIGASYISSGDIARTMMDTQTADSFKDGGLSPHEDRIRTEIFRRINACEVAVLDGFPRVRNQLEWLNNAIPAALYIVKLEWPMDVLITRWTSRMRDEFDTLKAYVMRDELYHKETELLFPVVNYTTNHKLEQNAIDVNTVIRHGVLRWLADAVPTFKCKDSAKSIAIDRFIKDHHVTLWEPLRRGTTYALQPEDIEKRLWDIINA